MLDVLMQSSTTPIWTPFVAAVETNDEGHPLRMKLTVVEGFRLTDIAAWAQPAPSHRHAGGVRSG